MITPPPTITFISSDNLRLNQGTTLIDPGVYGLDHYNNTLLAYLSQLVSGTSNLLSSNILITGTTTIIPISTTLLKGSYSLIYQTTDLYNTNGYKTRNLLVGIPPVMTLLGATTTVIFVGTPIFECPGGIAVGKYGIIDPGVTAIDSNNQQTNVNLTSIVLATDSNHTNILTNPIQIIANTTTINAINGLNPDIYTLTYTASDVDMFTSIINRTINILLMQPFTINYNITDIINLPPTDLVNNLAGYKINGFWFGAHLVYANGIYLVSSIHSSNNNVYYASSTDLITWTLRSFFVNKMISENLGDLSSSYIIQLISCFNKYFIAMVNYRNASPSLLNLYKSTDGITWTIFTTNINLNSDLYQFYYITQVNKYIFLHLSEIGGKIWTLLDNSTTWNPVYFNNNTTTSLQSVVPTPGYNPYTLGNNGIDILYNSDNNTYLLRGEPNDNSYFFTGILTADINGYIPLEYPKFILNYVYTRTILSNTINYTKFMTYGNGMYLTFDHIRNGSYLWSTDYLTWNIGNINPTGGLYPNEVMFARVPKQENNMGIVKNIFFINNRFIIFGRKTNDIYILYYSYDGINWSRDSNFNNNLIIRSLNNSAIAYYGCPLGHIINNTLVCVLSPGSNDDYNNDGIYKTPYPIIPGVIPSGKSNLCRFIVLT